MNTPQALMQKPIPTQVYTVLARFVDSPAKFRGVLLTTGAVVTGSAVIQMMLDEEFPDADLDVCTITTTHNAVQSWFELQGYAVKAISKSYSGCDNKPGKTSDEHFDRLQHCGRLRVIKLWNEARKRSVDLIELEDKSGAVDRYVKTFDLSCCMGTYDGESVRHMFPELTMIKRAAFVETRFRVTTLGDTSDNRSQGHAGPPGPGEAVQGQLQPGAPARRDGNKSRCIYGPRPHVPHPFIHGFTGGSQPENKAG